MNGRIFDMFRKLSFSFRRSSAFFKFNRSRSVLIWRRCLTQNRILFRNPIVRSKIKFGLGLGLISGLCNYGALAKWETNGNVEIENDIEHVYHGKKLNAHQTHQILTMFSCIQPYSKDLEMDMQNISKIFLEKCDAGEEAMSEEQFYRWLQYYLRTELAEKDRLIWKAAYDLEHCITLTEFRMGYALIRTMDTKRLRPKDLPKWCRVNIKSMDIEGKCYLDYDAITFWIGFGIRVGYINNRHPSGMFMTPEEIAFLTFNKYDGNQDGHIDEGEFEAIIYSLLVGKFTQWKD